MKNNNLFTIGEIAKAIGITRKIILNYEEKGLIVPDKKDGTAGNRYYTIDTFTKIRTIRVFQNFGLSLDEIRNYFNDTTELEPLIARLKSIRDELNLSIEKLSERAGKSADNIKEITVMPQTVYSRTYNSESISEKTDILRQTALEAMKIFGTDISRRMYFIEYPIDNPSENTYSIAIPSESEGEYVKKIPSFRAISSFHHGSYESIGATKEKILSYAEDHGIKLSGRCRHLYLEGPPQHKDKNKFITQIIMPIG